jgi:nucleotide-binding universal stress UspA family protein
MVPVGKKIAIKSILLPTDFSENSKYAMEYAVSFAAQYKAKLYVLHVLVSPHAMVGYEVAPFVSFERLYADMRRSSEQAMSTFIPEEVKKEIQVETAIVQGTPFLEILKFAREKEVDLIVIATHGRTGLSHVLFGSVAEKVVRKSPCPVLSIRHPEHEFVMP